MNSPGLREAKEWLANNRGMLIDCPNQPGRLLISRNACRKRHEASLNPDLKIYAEDFFRFSFRQGLSHCRDCRIGRQAARN